MTDIELVIRISEEKYKWINENNPKADKDSIVGTIVHGTPLHKYLGEMARGEDEEVVTISLKGYEKLVQDGASSEDIDKWCAAEMRKALCTYYADKIIGEDEVER